MESIVIFSKISKISDIYDIFDIFDIFDIYWIFSIFPFYSIRLGWVVSIERLVFFKLYISEWGYSVLRIITNMK